MSGSFFHRPKCAAPPRRSCGLWTVSATWWTPAAGCAASAAPGGRPSPRPAAPRRSPTASSWAARCSLREPFLVPHRGFVAAVGFDRVEQAERQPIALEHAPKPGVVGDARGGIRTEHARGRPVRALAPLTGVRMQLPRRRLALRRTAVTGAHAAHGPFDAIGPASPPRTRRLRSAPAVAELPGRVPCAASQARSAAPK